MIAILLAFNLYQDHVNDNLWAIPANSRTIGPVMRGCDDGYIW